MKRILSVLSILISLSSHSQTVNNDSNRYKRFYVQLDLPGLLNVERKSNFQSNTPQYTYPYTPNINATAGYSFKKDIAKKIKKSVQLNFLYYTSNQFIYGLKKIAVYSGFNDHSTYLSIAPELKLLFNKKQINEAYMGQLALDTASKKFLQAMMC